MVNLLQCTACFLARTKCTLSRRFGMGFVVCGLGRLFRWGVTRTDAIYQKPSGLRCVSSLTRRYRCAAVENLRSVHRWATLIPLDSDFSFTGCTRRRETRIILAPITHFNLSITQIKQTLAKAHFATVQNGQHTVGTVNSTMYSTEAVFT